MVGALSSVPRRGLAVVLLICGVIGQTLGLIFTISITIWTYDYDLYTFLEFSHVFWGMRKVIFARKMFARFENS